MESGTLYGNCPASGRCRGFNAHCLDSKGNFRAPQFALNNQIAGTAGSDAHAALELGAARLELPPFANTNELRQVIAIGKVRGQRSPFWVHFFSLYASFRRKAV
jgi:hypothetical protein